MYVCTYVFTYARRTGKFPVRLSISVSVLLDPAPSRRSARLDRAGREVDTSSRCRRCEYSGYCQRVTDDYNLIRTP